MTDAIDVAIVGAGPYGLSLAAHLRSSGVAFRQFGVPMKLWQTAMPAGMYLKSQGFASNLSDPAGRYTLERYCAEAGLPYASYGLPVPLDTFIGYGRWFQAKLCPELEETLVSRVERHESGFKLTLSTADQVRARRVVVAAGVEHFASIPGALAGLPSAACTHSSAHKDLAAFRDRDVLVVGAGQSALESAALLHENGARVQVVARERNLAWNGEPLAPDRPAPQRLREPESGLGSGWGTWFYSNRPELFRHLPSRTRVHRAQTALGPAGASWLRRRVEAQFPVLTGQTIRSARVDGDRVRLTLAGPGGPASELTADHLIAATGYRPDLARLTFLDRRLSAGIGMLAGSAAVDRNFESTVPGLYFIGPAAAYSFGPVMRFVYGADFAAHVVSDRLARTRQQPLVTAPVRS
ncbi:MAG: NAD(P)-binding domain-containing protein [Streptosporangiaceae bacterium]